METLKAYISNINPQLLEQINGKVSFFIRAFRDNNFISEEAFMKYICGEKYERNYYYDLKSKAISVLQILSLMSDSGKASEVKKNYDLCQKKFLIGQKFLNKGVRVEGLRLIKQAYRIAVKYDFVHLACELSSILFHDHIYYHPSQRKANFYRKKTDYYLRNYVAEKKAEHAFYEVIGIIHKTHKSIGFPNIIKKVNLHPGDSLKYWVYKSMIEVLYGFSLGDYLQVVKSCELFLNKVRGRNGVYSSHYLFFLMNIGVVHIALANYKEAESYLMEAHKYAPKKSVNDYLLRFYQTINALHSRNYPQAYTLYLENRKCPFEKIKQHFAIIEAYLCFLTHTGHLSLGANRQRFRLGKYLNETFKAQSDKQGSNISILIAELLVYLARDRGKFIDRVDAISNYSYRHLKGQDTRRAKRFIRILRLIPKANFSALSLRRLARKSIQYIYEHPVYMGDNLAIEIIPFEQLLELILGQLERKVA